MNIHVVVEIMCAIFIGLVVSGRFFICSEVLIVHTYIGWTFNSWEECFMLTPLLILSSVVSLFGS